MRMATLLNPNAPLFRPTSAAAEDHPLIHRPPPLPAFPAFFPCKAAILIHPPIYYPPNIPFFVPAPPPKYSPPPEEPSNEELTCRTVSASRGSLRGPRRGFRDQLVKRSSSHWVRKTRSSDPIIYPSPDDLQFCQSSGKCTVMIKNVPNKLRFRPFSLMPPLLFFFIHLFVLGFSSRGKLLQVLDQHCRSENRKQQKDGLPPSEFDFLYLPMDFVSGNNLGYAFVNFTTAAAAKRLYQDMHMKSWNLFGSRKICEITQAKIQGLDELVKHFKRSIFSCSSAEYLPVLFKPSRDGVRDTAEHVVGKLVQSPLL